MTRTALMRRLRFATLVTVIGLCAGCATSQPSSQVDKNRMSAAERIADRNDSRLDQRAR